MWKGNSLSQDCMYTMDENGDLFNVTCLILNTKLESAISKLLVQSHYKGKPTLSLAKCPFCHDQTSLMELNSCTHSLLSGHLIFLHTMISFRHLGGNFTVQKVTGCRATIITDKNNCFILFASPYAIHTNIFLWEVLCLIVLTCTTHFLRHLHWGHYQFFPIYQCANKRKFLGQTAIALQCGRSKCVKSEQFLPDKKARK